MALALPSIEFKHPELTIADVRVIHMITRLKEDPFYRTRSAGKKMIMIGVPEQWLLSFQSMGFQAWRITYVPTHSRDIMASVLQQPIARESVHVVVYGGDTGYSAWGAMRILSQSIFGLMQDGYIVFTEKRCRQWGTYLEQLGFDRLPFRWHEMNIWHKPPHHKLPQFCYIDGESA